MELKQISLTIPNSLLKASKSYSEELGYRNIQELILELLRNKVLAEKIERYKQIERDMKDAKKLSQKEAVNYIKNI